MIKNNHEYKYQLFVEMWEDDYTVAEIAKRLHLREFTVAGKLYWTHTTSLERRSELIASG
ncbi:hypothetical protein EFL19_02465 [Weissella paramesenteroides]|nr:hypothetical protein [Weissella paramesenteroides]